MANKVKFYVVWRGRKAGVFDTWEACERQVKGFTGAQFKAFPSRDEAEAALLARYEDYQGASVPAGALKRRIQQALLPSICVDAACNGSPGRLEYRAVWTESGEQVFHAGPYQQGTNNIGEFLAIVHALRWQAGQGLQIPIYSDSRVAIGWVLKGVCRTNLPPSPRNAPLFALIAEAEAWLAGRPLGSAKLLKWETALWGENPADFGRK